MITVSGLTKRYGKKDMLFTALEDVSFTIPAGSTAAIVGKSGSGKSTLMHIMGGLDHPTEGSVEIDGLQLQELKGKAIDRFRARDLGFVFQSFFVEANQTCYQNVSLPLEIANVALSERKKLVQAALEQVGLSDKLRVKAGNLSGGQKQRLAIARAIVNKPKLLLADEPTGNLDSATGEQIISLLFNLTKQNNTTVIIVTHDRELAARCQQQIEIKDGHLVQHQSNAAPQTAIKRRSSTKKVML